MQSQLELLKRLQTIDTTISKIRSWILEFPVKMRQLEKEFERRKQKLEKEKSAFEEVQAQRRKKEQQLKLESERLEKAQSRVLAVKTNKEYQAVLKEIEDIKQSNGEAETEILICMEKADTLSKDLKEQEFQHQKWLQEFEKQKQALQAEVKKSDHELVQQQTLRHDTVERVDPETIKRYEKLLEKRQGLAVVSIRNGLCQGCNMNIPPQTFIEIRKNDDAIMGCPFCSRILYVEDNM